MKFNKLKFSHYFIYLLMSINFFGAINLLNLTKNRNNTVLLIGHKLVGNLEIIFKENIENISVLYITLNFKDYIELRKLYGNKILFSLNLFHVFKAFKSKIIISSHGIFFHKFLKKGISKTIYCGHSIFGAVPKNKNKTIKFFKLYDEVWLHSPCEKNIFVNELDCDEDNLKTLGYPRNQQLLKSKSNIENLKFNNSFQNKKIILYAPTSNRGNTTYINSQFSVFNLEFYKFLNNVLPSNTIFLIKTHLNDEIPTEIKNITKNMSNIYFSSNLLINTDYDPLVISDVLLTDLSTIYVDYLLLEKPVYILSNPDPDPKMERSSILKNLKLPYINNKDEFKKFLLEVEVGELDNKSALNLKNDIYKELNHSKIIENINETIIKYLNEK